MGPALKHTSTFKPTKPAEDTPSQQAVLPSISMRDSGMWAAVTVAPWLDNRGSIFAVWSRKALRYFDRAQGRRIWNNARAMPPWSCLRRHGHNPFAGPFAALRGRLQPLLFSGWRFPRGDPAGLERLHSPTNPAGGRRPSCKGLRPLPGIALGFVSGAASPAQLAMCFRAPAGPG